MSYVTVHPDLLTSAVTSLEELSSTIGAANTAATSPTTGVLAAAADEVSVAFTRLMNEFAAGYQGAARQAAAFHEQFAGLVAGNGLAYAQTELANAVDNALAPVRSLIANTAAAPAAGVFTLVMGASGYPIPIEDYIQGIPPSYIDPIWGGGINLGINTPEGLYPLTGIKDLTFDVSAARGLTILDNAIRAAFGELTASQVNVFGYSQSAVIASMEMIALNPANIPGAGVFTDLNFTLVGNPSNPNGGLLARFPGLALPSLGLDVFGVATPDNSFPSRIYTIEYDGFGGFPQYPLNVVSDINAFLGIIELHGRYPFLSAQTLANAVELTNTTHPTLTEYYMIPTENLPILSPLRAIPIIGHPLAALVEPCTEVIVNLGYGSTTNGWSPDPPNVATGFGVIPPVPPGDIVAALAAGAQQGVVDFAHELSLIGPSDFTSLLPTVDTAGLNRVLTGAQYSLSSPQHLVESLLNANLKIGYATSAIAASAYSTVLPTTDIVNAALTAIPAYNVSLFGNGILQALNGDPVNGLINAFGKPVAATVGLGVLMGGFEVRVFQHAASDIVAEINGLFA